MYEQLSIFDLVPAEAVKMGDWVTEHGPVIPHIMRQSFIGRLVVLDKSTVSHEWFEVGRLVDDILVRFGIIADDNRDIVAGHDGTRVFYDKASPMTEILITPITEEYHQWKEKK